MDDDGGILCEGKVAPDASDVVGCLKWCVASIVRQYHRHWVNDVQSTGAIGAFFFGVG